MAAVLAMVGAGDESPDVVRGLLDVGTVRGRPQYAMAPDHPLLLYACDYSTSGGTRNTGGTSRARDAAGDGTSAAGSGQGPSEEGVGGGQRGVEAPLIWHRTEAAKQGVLEVLQEDLDRCVPGVLQENLDRGVRAFFMLWLSCTI